ncbi:MAG: methyltransferase domain-containing protein [Chloroflexi bacterium]|nr:methyltransferase domain-containing protein [Chloroflexota bacterium]
MSGPDRATQMTKLYEIIGGYHATQLLEVGRALGVWEAIAESPSITSDGLSAQLGTDRFYTDVLLRTAFAFELIDRDGDGWRMAAHFDEILGRPDATFYLGNVARIHLLLGRDYEDYATRFRDGSLFSFQAHDREFIEAVADGLKTLPRIFSEVVLPKLPALRAKLERGGTLLDVGCGGGWALVTFAERFPKLRCIGVDIERRSIDMANALLRERGLADRCEARLLGVEGLTERDAYDVATTFLVVHELEPRIKPAVFEAVARSLKPGGSFVIFDETYPETEEALRTMPSRFAALAQWFELTWGNRVDTRTALLKLLADAGLAVAEETMLSRFTIIVATK